MHFPRRIDLRDDLIQTHVTFTTSTPSQGALERARLLAFRGLFDAELPYVWNTLRYLGVRSEDVQDLAHEVFVTVFQRLDSLDPTRSPRPFLFTIAANAANNYRRLAQHRREVLAESPDALDERKTVEEHAADREELDLVTRALSSLEPARREVFILHDIDGFAMPEVAEALSIPLNTAYSRLRLSRADFKAEMDRLRNRGKKS